MDSTSLAIKIEESRPSVVENRDDSTCSRRIQSTSRRLQGQADRRAVGDGQAVSDCAGLIDRFHSATYEVGGLSRDQSHRRISYRGTIMIFGYDAQTVNEHGLKQMREICLCVSPALLRELASFLLEAANQVENATHSLWHRHSPGRLADDLGCDVVVALSEDKRAELPLPPRVCPNRNTSEDVSGV